MKKILLAVILSLLLVVECIAINGNDNGYTWNSTSHENKIGLCKEISKRVGRDYMYWYTGLCTVYNTTNRNILNWKISEAAVMLEIMEQALNGQ